MQHTYIVSIFLKRDFIYSLHLIYSLLEIKYREFVWLFCSVPIDKVKILPFVKMDLITGTKRKLYAMLTIQFSKSIENCKTLQKENHLSSIRQSTRKSH